jgi:hypothetical protein
MFLVGTVEAYDEGVVLKSVPTIICSHVEMWPAVKRVAELDLKLNSDEWYGERNRCLIGACASGSLEIVTWVVEMLEITNDDARWRDSIAFVLACKYGRTNVARWFADTFKLTTNDIRSGKHYYTYACVGDNWAFSEACSSGHTGIAIWLVDRFGLTPADTHARGNYAFYSACINGHLETAQWLYGMFGLSNTVPATAEANGISNNTTVNSAFKTACARGHLYIAIWLAGMFPSNSANQTGFHEAFSVACANGKLEIVKWLTSINAVSDANLAVSATPAFVNACRNGHLRIIKWFFRRHRYTTDIARMGAKIALDTGCTTTAKWIMAQYGIVRCY